MALTSSTLATFDQDVINNSTLTIVDFWAEWCGPCKMLTPTLEYVAQELGNAVNIVKVNVDEQSDLATKYNVRSIPTLVMFKDGQAIDTRVGALPKSSLIEWIQSN